MQKRTVRVRMFFGTISSLHCFQTVRIRQRLARQSVTAARNHWHHTCMQTSKTFGNVLWIFRSFRSAGRAVNHERAYILYEGTYEPFRGVYGCLRSLV